MAIYLDRTSRASKAVLVPAAHSLGHIAVIRSLGRAGYRVHAVADHDSALGFRSRFASKCHVHPAARTEDFRMWFKNYIRKYHIGLVINTSDISPVSLGWLDEYSNLFPLVQDRYALSAAKSKHNLFRCFRGAPADVQANLPPGIELSLDRDLPALATLKKLGAPLFIKLDRAHARREEPDEVRKCATPESALSELRSLAGHYRAAVVQGFAEGQGVGAFLLRKNGKTVARFMHRRVHEVPHTGGASSLRQSWWHEEIMRDAERKIEYLNWDGPVMVEYRWCPETDNFNLMEINFRFWGSLHLAMHAGVDFPTLLADHFFFGMSTAENRPRQDVLCRCLLPGEWGYLRSLWQDSGVPMTDKLRSLYEALALTLDPRVRSDLLFPGDRSLFYHRMREFSAESWEAVLVRAKARQRRLSAPDGSLAVGRG